MTFTSQSHGDTLRDSAEGGASLIQRRAKKSLVEQAGLRVESEGDAYRAFTAWFQDQHQQGGIAIPSEGRLDVQPSLSKFFCIGMRDLRYFIGVPKDCIAWFANLPWLHAQVSPESSWLGLECKRSGRSSTLLSAFSLNFNVRPEGYLAALQHYHYLDVRSVEENSVRSGEVTVGSEVFLTLSIKVVKTSGSMRAAFDKTTPQDIRIRNAR